MRKTGKKREKEQSAAGQFRFPFHGLAREALWETVVLSGFGFVQDELDPRGISATSFRSISSLGTTTSN